MGPYVRVKSRAQNRRRLNGHIWPFNRTTPGSKGPFRTPNLDLKCGVPGDSIKIAFKGNGQAVKTNENYTPEKNNCTPRIEKKTSFKSFALKFQKILLSPTVSSIFLPPDPMLIRNSIFQFSPSSHSATIRAQTLDWISPRWR